MHPRCRRVGDAVDLPQRFVQRRSMLLVGPQQEGSVDVEEEEQRYRSKVVSGSKRRAKAATSRAQASTSSSATSSTGECM